MSGAMPELGSKISLVSKADIRYEGRLFTVDPQQCTIALSSVRSFGTEDRRIESPIPAQNQVYDYILFRGKDIKDIRVLNVPQQTFNDPAIMQLSVPAQSLAHQQFGGHPVVGHVPVPPMGGQYAGAGFGAAMGMGGGGEMPSGLAPGMGVPNRGVAAGGKPNVFLDMIGGASRSTTPVSIHSHKSGVDQSVQAGGAGKKDEKRTGARPGQSQQQRTDMRRRGSRSRERKDSRASGGGGDGQDQQQHNRNQYNRAPGGPRNPNYQHQNQNYGYQQHRGEHQGGGGGGPGGPGGNHQMMRGGWIQRGPPRPRMNRPRGGPTGGGFRPMNPNQSGGGVGQNANAQPGRKRNTLKFDNDYDFEQANTEFEELRSQLAKVKIDEASSTGTSKTSETGTTTATATATVTNTSVTSAVAAVNGEIEKKDDSGNETGAGETEQEEEQEVFYDKKKSFFDKISCEAVERAKGKSQRTDWRQERKLNSETFGVAATRRGAFRGRGGFRGMGYRGGFRPGYRPQQQQQQQQLQQPRREHHGGAGQGKVTYPILHYKAPHRHATSDDDVVDQNNKTSKDSLDDGKVDETSETSGPVEIIDLTNLIEACPGLGQGPVDDTPAPAEVEGSK